MHNVEQVPGENWRSWSDRTGGTILDVREPWEWSATGVLPGSETISLGQLAGEMKRLDRHSPVLVVCQSGNRSMSAAQMLIANGFRNVANLAGGIMRAAAAY